MTSKRSKIKKVLDVREQALEQRTRTLAQSKNLLKDAIDEHARESERLRVAELHRERLMAGPVSVTSWIDAEQWVIQKQQALSNASGRVARAESTVQQATGDVVQARIEKKRIELLDTRLAEQQTRQENRIEQRMSDEFAQRIARKFEPG